MNLFLNTPSEDLIRFVTAQSIQTPTKQINKGLSLQQRYTANEVQDILNNLNPDMSYQDWIHVGMALHSGGYDWTLWDNWSSQGSKYQPNECMNKWKTFHSGGGVGMGTLVQMARQAGYSKERGHFPKESKVDNFRAIKAYHWSQMFTLPRREYLIKGLLEQGGMSVIYGASNTGKTFVGLDMACHVALGWNWQGLKTKVGKVVYIAAEGGLGIRERLEAFRIHHKMAGYADVFIIPSNIGLCGENTELEALLSAVSYIKDIKLVVVDTLARTMGGADENTAKDMGSFIQNCDFIREEIKAHVMIIHHSGKDETRGARGSNALKGAIDTEVHVTQDNGVISAQVTKQRDGKTGKVFSFVLQTYEVGKDEDGDSIISGALEGIDVPQRKDRLTGQAAKAHQALLNLMIDKGVSYTPKKGMNPQNVVRIDDFRTDFLKAGIASTDKPDSLDKAFHRAKEKLKDKGYIAEWDGYLWLTDKPDNTGQTS